MRCTQKKKNNEVGGKQWDVRVYASSVTANQTPTPTPPATRSDVIRQHAMPDRDMVEILVKLLWLRPVSTSMATGSAEVGRGPETISLRKPSELLVDILSVL